MKWFSHIAIASAPAALINPILIASVATGAIAPDALEKLIRTKHRAETHILIYWLIGSIAALIAAFSIQSWTVHIAGLMLGGLSHILLDSLTPTGVPLAPYSAARVHFFGGRVVTGSVTEYAIAVCVIAICLLIWKMTGGVAWLPIGWDWAKYYENGLIDGFEWRQNRFRFF